MGGTGIYIPRHPTKVLLFAVSCVEFDGPRNRTVDPSRRFPRGRAGAPRMSHTPSNDPQGFGELESGEVGTEAVLIVGWSDTYVGMTA